jgi:predicted pyridoxine 5'-phosphate oxidase superfamily flavin-nucleotide-binding protein
MIKVNVSVSNVSADRFWDIRKPIPPIQINTNLNMVGMEKKSEDLLEVPFVLTINYNPSIAQINLKGKAYVNGDKGELERIYKDYEEKKPPPSVIVQSISNIVFIESVIVSRTLNIPPPIPLPQITQGKPPDKKPSEIDYSA